jgi:hypothetical protein
MFDCPYCGAKIDDKYNFCLNCNRQVQCIHCKELLVPDKPICFVCGKPIAAQETSQTQMNEFTLEEKQTKSSASRSIKGRFSDEAFGQAVAFLGGLPQSRPLSQPPTIQKSQPQALPLPATAEQLEYQHVESSTIEAEIPSSISTHSDGPSGDAKTRAAHFFETDGDGQLISMVTDYKGENKGDQQKRFMLLYVHAYNHHFGKPMPSEKVLFSAMRGRSIFDSNCYGYFDSVTSRYLVKTESGFRVNLDGQKEIELIVPQVEDQTRKGFQDWDKPGKPRSKRSSLNKDDVVLLNKWIDIPFDLDFDIRKLKKVGNYVLFGYWLLTKKLDAAKALKSAVVFEFLKRKYTLVPGTPKAFSSALRRSYNSPYFQKTSEGLYYLTPEGESRVQKWLQGEPIPDVSDTEEGLEGEENDDLEENEDE